MLSHYLLLIKKSVPILFGLLFSPYFMYAGGLQINYQGQRQTGMANAGVGLALDASSVFFNPGALALNYQGGVMLGSNVLAPRTIFLEAPPSDYLDSTERFVITPIYLYAGFNGKEGTAFENFSFGVSLNNPFGGTVKWADDWLGKNISREFSMNTFFLQPTISYQLSENIGIGAGFTYGIVNLLSRKAFNTDIGEGSVQFTGSGIAQGFNIGLFAQATKEVSLGVSYRTAMNIEIEEGLTQFTVAPSLEEAFPDQNFQTEFTLPRVLSIGLGYKPDERTQFAIDLIFTGWQVFDSLDLVLEDPDLVSSFPTRNYTNSVSLRLGGEYALSESFLLRGGIYYDGSPVPSQYVTPEFPDADRIGFSLGLGYRVLQKFNVDISYTYDFTGERTSSFIEAGFAGKYLSTTSSLGIGIGYLF